MLKSLIIGEIVNVHGVRGALKVTPLTDDPKRFRTLKQVTVSHQNHKKTEKKIYAVVSAVLAGNFVLLQLEGIDDRDKAMMLRGALLEIPREEAIVLPEDHYFIGDLIGCRVTESDGTVLGFVRDVFQTGSNDVYRVVSEQGAEILLPAIGEVILRIDIAAGEITVKLLPGLREVYHAD